MGDVAIIGIHRIMNESYTDVRANVEIENVALNRRDQANPVCHPSCGWRERDESKYKIS